ncbi:MAG TPA: tRNA (adenosine(37)-N6)-threonylcarbamoyltransferase complex ATPase subunit type 1 TsaE [Acidimicrobiia bacterium]|nr:tRNA (adenosine(37)-N6)-threonylcarbamoyltransferase complex ATPase subunit type 1 TsaE [Acidimicrobiia bacterium]
MTALVTRGGEATESVGEEIGRQLRAGDLVVLAGELGAGKTTFVKGVARGLGVTDPVTSPTFTIVQEYGGRVPLAHVDVYRLVRIQELHDIGFEELLEGHVVIVEWGDVIARALPADRLEVRITMLEGDEDARAIEIVPHGAAWAARRLRLDEALAAHRSA